MPSRIACNFRPSRSVCAWENCAVTHAGTADRCPAFFRPESSSSSVPFDMRNLLRISSLCVQPRFGQESRATLCHLICAACRVSRKQVFGGMRAILHVHLPLSCKWHLPGVWRHWCHSCDLHAFTSKSGSYPSLASADRSCYTKSVAWLSVVL